MSPVKNELRQLTVLGHDIRVSVREGSAARRPLLLCNGIGSSLELLQPFVDHLDPRITTIRFDVPGVGGSPDPRLPYGFPVLARGVGQLMDQLGYREYDALGISWGGGLAQQLAYSHPSRCRRVVLVATGTGSLMVPASPKVLWIMASPRRHRDAQYAANVAAEIYGGKVREKPELVKGLLHKNSRVGSRRGYFFQMLAGTGWSSLPVLPFIKQPTLILAGDDDPIIPLANAKIMARLLPNSRLHVYHDGHLGLMTSVDELAPMIADFLLEGD